MNPELSARKLAATASEIGVRFVLAESCTCGMAAALLGGIAGVSETFCGSAVTYRAAVKSAWLGIDEAFVVAHTTESAETSLAMARAVLERTNDAEFSAAITGHLGPNAPAEKDGLIFLATAWRVNETILTRWSQRKLTKQQRTKRQTEAADAMLNFLANVILEVNVRPS